MNKIELSSPACVAAEDEMFACAAPRGDFPAAQYKKDFPILAQQVNGHPLVYLDSAASAQKPRMVTEAMQRFIDNDYANIHRGVHALSVRATEKYEAVRGTVRRFINAEHDDEIIFTKGATEAINLVAQAWGSANLNKGDEIVLTTLEHHSNIVPWQILAKERGANLRVVPITPEGDVRLEDVKAALDSRTKIVAIAHVSNALGTVLPVREIAAAAHAIGALVLIDGCQAISHMPVDVRECDADFYAFSGHKLYGPTGIGVLYGKRAVLAKMPPWQGGGDMIASVSFAETTYKEPPHRFEAGTPPIIEVIGLGAAIDYVSTIGMARIVRHEEDLLSYAIEKLRGINSVQLIGAAPAAVAVATASAGEQKLSGAKASGAEQSRQKRAGIISFVMPIAHPHDIGTVLDSMGIAVRAGHHCAQPLMDHLGLAATARASFGLYNTREDIDALIKGIEKVREIFA